MRLPLILKLASSSWNWVNQHTKYSWLSSETGLVLFNLMGHQTFYYTAFNVFKFLNFPLKTITSRVFKTKMLRSLSRMIEIWENTYLQMQEIVQSELKGRNKSRKNWNININFYIIGKLRKVILLWKSAKYLKISQRKLRKVELPIFFAKANFFFFFQQLTIQKLVQKIGFIY